MLLGDKSDLQVAPIRNLNLRKYSPTLMDTA